MKISHNSRQSILEKIDRLAYTNTPKAEFENIDSEIYKPIEGSLAECFAAEMTAIGSRCHLCETEKELFDKLSDFIAEKGLKNVYCAEEFITKNLDSTAINAGEMHEIDAAITDCEALVARTGSVLVSAAGKAGRQMNIFPPIHIIEARETQLFPYLSDAIRAVQAKYGENLPSFISTITGASRTADIEKTLVMGAHGPKEIHVFLIKSQK